MKTEGDGRWAGNKQKKNGKRNGNFSSQKEKGNETNSYAKKISSKNKNCE